MSQETSIDELIAAVLRFPEEVEWMTVRILSRHDQVSRPCLVPLSKEGFTHGRLVHTNEFYLGDQVMSHVQAAEYLRQKKIENLDDRPKGILKKPIDGAEKKMNTTTTGEESSNTSDFNSRHEDGDDMDLTIYEISEVEDADHAVVSSEVRDIKGEFEVMRRVIDSAESGEAKGVDREKLRGLLDLLKQNEDSCSIRANGVESNVRFLCIPTSLPLSTSL